ncbi:MAG TPA: FG-GAP-like repeat-containing protein [Gammaproteobacteria bacterium]|nr:FG-GAP-like repeat-containing protein [Gammaproteobacteria bacterium]
MFALVLLLAGAEAAAQTHFTSTPVTNATAGQPYLYPITVTGQGLIRIIATTPLPPWLTLTDAGNGTATLAGTPPDPNTVWQIGLIADDDLCRTLLFSLCEQQSFLLSVGANQPPIVVPPGIPPQTAAVARAFTLDLSATFTDPEGDPFVLRQAGLPPTLTLTDRVISGTPAAGDALLSPYLVTVTADDGRGGTVAAQFTLTVSPDAPPAVVGTGIPDQSVVENAQLNLDVAPLFTDADGDPITFAAAGLPPGFQLAGSVIAGTATTGALAASPYRVTVTAADNRGGSVADTFDLTIVPLARADVYVSAIAAAPAPAARGDAVVWTVTVGNHGPSPSGAVPVNLEFAGNPFTFSSNPCTLTAAANRQQLACNAGPIESGATQTLELAGAAAQTGDVFVTAAIPAATTVPLDPAANNNRGAAALNVGEAIVTAPAQRIALAAAGVALGDLDGDGFADLVAAAAGAEPFVLLDIADPTALDGGLVQAGAKRRGLASIPLTFGSTGAGADVALADLDNDGDLDVVVANGPGSASAAFANDGHGVLTLLATLGPPARNDRAVAVADVNGDGFADVVIASAGGNSLHTSASGASFAQSPLPAASGGAVDVALADVAGSPLPDLVFVNAGGAAVRYENLGGGKFGPAVTVDAGPSVGVAAADFNGDNRVDLVLARMSAPGNALPANPVYLNNGAGGFVSVEALGASPTATVLTGDVDGDGTNDVVAINATGVEQLFLGDGNGNFRLHSQIFSSPGATRAALGPVGRQKRADLVTAGSSSVDVFFNDGRGNLGLGDTAPPVITLMGTSDVALEIGAAYQDLGATAVDDVDGTLQPTAASNVDTQVIGTYQVTYTAMDSAGNAAAPVSRNVRVNAHEAAQGGGGGAGGAPLLVLLLAASLSRLRAARAEESLHAKQARR